MRKKNFFLLLVTLCLCIFAQAQMLSVYELSSPNGQLVLTVENGRVLQYSLSLEGRSVIHPSAICMTMQNGNIWGKNGEVVGTSTSSTSEKVYPVAGNYRELTDHYNELSLKFKDGYSVIFRMYNEGMAYRFCGNLPEQDSLIVVDEEASFNLADDPAVILPETTNFGCIRRGFRLLFFPEQPFQESSLPASLFRGALSGCLRKLSGYFPAGLLLLAHNLLDLQHGLFLVLP